MGFRILYTLAILFTALAMIPAGAHLLSLPNKIKLTQEPYYAAQSAYRGWAWLSLFMIGALLIDISLSILLWRAGQYLGLTIIAAIATAAALIIFFVWIFPANTVTRNWTVAIHNWEGLRTQWEYSNAVSAALIFLALCCVTLAAVHEPTLLQQMEI